MKETGRLIAVVTGGNKNLGRALSMDLANQGVFVVILAKDGESNNKIVSEIRSLGGVAEARDVDLRNTEEIKKAFFEILGKYGAIDILINNAAVSYFETAKDIDEQKCADMIDINLKAVYLSCKITLGSMLNRGAGTIINISSIYGLRADKKTSVYSMTKFGLVGYTKGLHADYRDKGIRAKVFCPTAFGEDAVLKTKTLSREIIKSASDPKDLYNEYSILSKKVGPLKILLIERKAWAGKRTRVSYILKIV